MSISFLLSDSVVASLKSAEMAKSEASQKGVIGLVALAADVCESRFQHGAAVKLGESLKKQAGFKAAVAKFYSEKAAAIVGFAHDQALLVVKGMPKSDEKTAAYHEAVLSSISALGTLKSVAAVMAKIRPPKAADAPAADAPAAVVDLSSLQMFFDLLAVFARGFLQAHELNEITAVKKAGQLPRRSKKAEKIAA